MSTDEIAQKIETLTDLLDIERPESLWDLGELLDQIIPVIEELKHLATTNADQVHVEMAERLLVSFCKYCGQACKKEHFEAHIMRCLKHPAYVMRVRAEAAEASLAEALAQHNN